MGRRVLIEHDPSSRPGPGVGESHRAVSIGATSWWAPRVRDGSHSRRGDNGDTPTGSVSETCTVARLRGRVYYAVTTRTGASQLGDARSPDVARR
jgi:hypothetical protein